jgi:Skp family chaperone for outer membrane proteins
MPDIPELVCDRRDPWDDLLPILDHELNRLPERYRVPIVLCDLEGRTRKQAARQVGCPEGTLSSRLARARGMLARRLARHGVGVSAAAFGAMLSHKATAGPPAAVVISTVKAAAWVAAGHTATTGGLISAKVASLTEGVLKAMLLAKLKTALKASLGLAAVLLVLAAIFGPGRPPSAAAPAPGAAAAPRGRVAVFNLTAVVKSYSKYKKIQDEVGADVKKFEDRIKKKQAEADDLRRRLQSLPLDKAQDLERALSSVQREIEDVNNEARRELAKKTDELTLEIYKEVQSAARRYAKEHELDIVLHYNDAAEADDPLSAANVSRKMQAGGSVPIYLADGVDITAEIVNVLNGK